MCKKGVNPYYKKKRNALSQGGQIICTVITSISEAIDEYRICAGFGYG